MIVIEQVLTAMGKGVVVVRYDDEAGNEHIARIDIEDIAERCLQFRRLVGRKPSEKDVRDIIVEMVNEIRKRRERFRPILPLDKLIGIDLEEGETV